MAAKSVDQSKLMLRMCDLTSEPKRMLPPIKDYEKEPLVSLEKAIQPLLSLVADLEEMVRIVKQNCQHPRDHLSPDESASIMLYTVDWMPRESSFYFILNNALRSQNRNELLPWFLYLRLFIFALSKLPSSKHRMIYRGIKMDISDEFPEGKTFVWWSFSSSTSSIKVLEEFLGQSGYRTIFNIECDSAKDISQHSFYESENEMLMYPARQFQVVSSMNPENQLKIIHLKETQPPSSLIYIPQSTSTITYQNQRLEQLIEQCEHHSRISLEKQNLIDEDMEIVVKEAIIKKQCEILHLHDNKITSVGASIIAKALNNNNNNNSTLENLYLTDNHLCNSGIQSIAKMLSLNNCRLRLLDLQSTKITYAGIEYIAAMLEMNTMLHRLLLGWNKISDRGIELLANALIHHNTTLLTLTVDGHKLVGDMSVVSLVEMLKHNKRLKYLNIKECNLSEKGKEKLRQIVQSKKGFKLDV